jgi:hypothetical protein
MHVLQLLPYRPSSPSPVAFLQETVCLLTKQEVALDWGNREWQILAQSALHSALLLPYQITQTVSWVYMSL